MSLSKGISIISIAFIVLISSVAAISWIFYNTYFGSRYQLSVLEQSKLDTIYNQIEKGKNFLRQALGYTSHQALKDFARKGGGKPWICNTPNYPTLSKSTERLSKNTRHRFNNYFNEYSTELPLSLTKKDFMNVEYRVFPDKLSKGEYDSGDFNVEVSGGGILFNTNDISISDELNLKKEINKNRFWYLYNGFKEWSLKNVFGKGICDCVSKCKGCDCAKKVAKKSLKDLRGRFDKHVSCGMTKRCCVNEKGGMCMRSQCLNWKQNKCSMDCEMKEVRISSESSSNTGPNSITGLVTNDDCYQIVPVENRLAAIYTYTCKDEKYLVPGKGGPQPLTFKVKAFASYRDLDGCKNKVPCGTCPGPCICPPEPKEPDEPKKDYNPPENPPEADDAEEEEPDPDVKPPDTGDNPPSNKAF